MTLTGLTASTLGRLRANFEQYKVILIHPDSQRSALVLAGLLADPPGPLFYYCLDENVVSLELFLTRLARELAGQEPSFGQHLVGRVQDREPWPALVEALARNLAGLCADPYLLVLDEYDRADAVPDIHAFVEDVLDSLPPNCHLLIRSRSLPRLPWLALIARREALVLKDGQVIVGGPSGRYVSENPRLEVYGFGPGRVVIDGRPVTTWEGRLPRDLLFYVINRPGVRRDDILRAFWPELAEDQAVNVFHVTKRRLHKALQALGVDILTYAADCYQLNPDLTVSYDVYAFVERLVAARSAADAEALPLWERALICVGRSSYRVQRQPGRWQTGLPSGRAAGRRLTIWLFVTMKRLRNGVA